MSSGTFTEVSESEAVVINDRGNLSLAFVGTGTVVLQRYLNGAWHDVPDGSWSADTEDIIYSGGNGTQYRLNCTAYGADIAWELG